MKYKDIFKVRKVYALAAAALFALSIIHHPSSLCAAAVVSRPSVAPTATRVNPTLRPVIMPTPAPIVTESVPEPVETVVDIINDKSAKFRAVLERECAASGDVGASALADLIRAQRNAFESADRTADANRAAQSAISPCDTGLRTCIKQNCGNDFAGCFADGDTELGRKLDACRRNLVCAPHEYNLFTNEIKLDIVQAARLANYNDALTSGETYNTCIKLQCGNDFAKCLNRTAANNAIASCNNQLRAAGIANPDTTLSGNMTNALTQFRSAAEIRIKEQEEHLYVLRNEMRDMCRSVGAVFDDRTLDCVFTVNLWTDINESATPTASQKRYAGDVFTCTTDWFGVDITTHMENAYRTTRAQTAASSQMMGTGLGTAVGAITSGAIGRAMDTQRANRAVDAAQSEHTATYDSVPTPEQRDQINREKMANTVEANKDKNTNHMINSMFESLPK